MSAHKLPWRTGYARGGGLGIWSHGCRTDDPDVCYIAAVPDKRDVALAEFIVRACNAYPLAAPPPPGTRKGGAE